MTHRPVFSAALMAAMRPMDIDWVRRNSSAGDDPDDDDHILRASLHMARYECRQVEPELRHASGHWLREGGFRRASGEPVLPEGQLA